MPESYHKKTASGQPPQISRIYSNLAEREGFQVVRSASATPTHTYPVRARAFVFTATGAQAIARDIGPRWRAGEPVPRAGDGEPNALGALSRNAHAHAAHEAEEAGGRRRAA